jgi:hypothetical protein
VLECDRDVAGRGVIPQRPPPDPNLAGFLVIGRAGPDRRSPLRSASHWHEKAPLGSFSCHYSSSFQDALMRQAKDGCRVCQQAALLQATFADD